MAQFNYRDGALRLETGLESQKDGGVIEHRATVTFTDGHTGLTKTIYGDWKPIEDARQDLRDLHRIFETN